jgi:hypothetical protein
MPAAERPGESITRRIGLMKCLTRKGADAILVSRPKYAVKEANLKVKVRCKPTESLANGAEGRSTTDRNAINWHEVERTVSNHRQRI